MRWSRHDFLYWLEHKEFPRAFFVVKENFVNAIAHKEDALYEVACRLLNKLQEEVSVDAEFEPEEFSTEICRVKDGVMAVVASFPEPEEDTECYKIILMFNEDFSKQRYFTLEKGRTFGEKGIFLCEWTEDCEHCNYGVHPMPVAIEQCVKMF